MITTTDTKHFETNDLGLASYLVACGFPLQDMGGPQGQRRTFRFDAAAAPRAPEFYRDGLVKARSFSNALRDLKTLLRET